MVPWKHGYNFFINIFKAKVYPTNIAFKIYKIFKFYYFQNN